MCPKSIGIAQISCAHIHYTPCLQVYCSNSMCPEITLRGTMYLKPSLLKFYVPRVTILHVPQVHWHCSNSMCPKSLFPMSPSLLLILHVPRSHSSGTHVPQAHCSNSTCPESMCLKSIYPNPFARDGDPIL